MHLAELRLRIENNFYIHYLHLFFHRAIPVTSFSTLYYVDLLSVSGTALSRHVTGASR